MNAQSANQEIQAAAGAKTHQCTGGDAHADQHVSHFVGPCIKRGIREAFGFTDQGHGVRGFGNLRFKRLMNGSGVTRRSGGIPAVQDLRAFGIRQGRDTGQGCITRQLGQLGNHMTYASD